MKIIYSNYGEFAFHRFINSLTHENPIGIIGFPLKLTQKVHGDLLFQSSLFLIHDMLHWFNFLSDYLDLDHEDEGNFIIFFRHIWKKSYLLTKEQRKIIDATLFFMLHEEVRLNLSHLDSFSWDKTYFLDSHPTDYSDKSQLLDSFKLYISLVSSYENASSIISQNKYQFFSEEIHWQFTRSISIVFNGNIYKLIQSRYEYPYQNIYFILSCSLHHFDVHNSVYVSYDVSVPIEVKCSVSRTKANIECTDEIWELNNAQAFRTNEDAFTLSTDLLNEQFPARKKESLTSFELDSLTRIIQNRIKYASPVLKTVIFENQFFDEMNHQDIINLLQSVYGKESFTTNEADDGSNEINHRYLKKLYTDFFNIAKTFFT